MYQQFWAQKLFHIEMVLALSKLLFTAYVAADVLYPWNIEQRNQFLFGEWHIYDRSEHEYEHMNTNIEHENHKRTFDCHQITNYFLYQEPKEMQTNMSYQYILYPTQKMVYNLLHFCKCIFENTLLYKTNLMFYKIYLIV